MKNINPKLVIALLIIITSCIYSQGQWSNLDSPTSKRIWRIHCLDSLNCWAAGDSGLIIHTSNGGEVWQLQNSTIYNNILDIFFLNKNLGWAVAIKFDEPSGSYFLKTSDGGATWQSKLFDSLNVYFFTVYFIDSLNGFLAGAPSYIFFRTSDGGTTWNTVEFDSNPFASLPINDVVFYSKQYGFACGGQRDVIGVIWKTTDYGLSWSSYELGPEPLIEMYIVDSLNILGVGGDYEYGTGIARTTNGGNNWTYVEPGFFGVATGVSFRNSNESWGCLGGEGKFIFSSDSGLNWEIKITPELSGINDLTFTDSLHGFAVGDGGVILKYKPTITSAIEIENNIVETNFLFQNYPNPFNPSTKISWQSAIGGWQSLKIYDVLGNEVAALVSEYKPAGKYEVDINLVSSAKNPASGVYFYRLQVGDLSTSSGQSFIQTKKMLLLR